MELNPSQLFICWQEFGPHKTDIEFQERLETLLILSVI